MVNKCDYVVVVTRRLVSGLGDQLPRLKLYTAERLSDASGRNIVLVTITRKTDEFIVTDKKVTLFS